MMIYKIFRIKGEDRELVGTLPERRDTGRVTEESIEKYVHAFLGSFADKIEVILDIKVWRFE